MFLERFHPFFMKKYCIIDSNFRYQRQDIVCSNGPLTRYVKLQVAHAPGMPGTFPHHRLQRKLVVSEPGMQHGTCVTHVPWCMSGSITRDGGENAHAHAQTVILRIWGPWRLPFQVTYWKSLRLKHTPIYTWKITDYTTQRMATCYFWWKPAMMSTWPCPHAKVIGWRIPTRLWLVVGTTHAPPSAPVTSATPWCRRITTPWMRTSFYHSGWAGRGMRSGLDKAQSFSKMSFCIGMNLVPSRSTTSGYLQAGVPRETGSLV